MDGAVGTHGQAVAQVRGEVGGADADHDDFLSDTLFTQAQGLFQSDVVERVGGQLDAVGNHAGAVGFDLNADVVVHHALVADKNLHV